MPLAAIAERFGTPCYVYSRAALEGRYRALRRARSPARPHLVCYAMKANSNLAVLDLFARLGSGFDIVSGGELARVLAAGGDPGKVVFSGVGKTEAEMEAALDAGILCFNVESAAELERARRGRRPRSAASRRCRFRVNPDVDPQTHPYIATGLKESKFGVAFDDAPALYRRRARCCRTSRSAASTATSARRSPTSRPTARPRGKMLELVDRLAADGIALEHVDLGGGLGIRYRDEATDRARRTTRAMLRALFAGAAAAAAVRAGPAASSATPACC